MKTGFAL